MNDTEVLCYLDSLGLTPEFQLKRIRYRHLQNGNRILSISTAPFFVSFIKPTLEFATRWQLDENGILPYAALASIREVLLDFFRLEEINPPAGAPPFLDKLREIENDLRWFARRYQRPHPFFGFDDLRQEGSLKAWKLYLEYGHKPCPEWRRIFKSAFGRKINSLLTAHFESVRRGKDIEFVPLTAEIEELV